MTEKKKSQVGDAAANLDLTISTAVDEGILSEHKLELAKLKRNAEWLKTDGAGVCTQCGCDIPINRLKAVLTTHQCVTCAGAND